MVLLQKLGINNKMKLIKSYVILFLLSCSAMAQDFLELDLKKLSDEGAFQAITADVSGYDKKQKSVLAEKIFASERRVLVLKALSLPEIPLRKEFEKAPNSDYKFQLILDILRDDSQWTIPLVAGMSSVGSPYHRSSILCDSVINKFFKEGEIDWSGPLTKDRREKIALTFEQYLIENQNFKPQKVSSKPRKNLARNDRSERTSRQPLRDSKTPLGKDSSAKNQSSSQWIYIVVVVALTIFGFWYLKRKQA